MNYIKQRTTGREIVFVSFGDSRYVKSLERLELETADFPFTTRLFLTEKDLPVGSLSSRIWILEMETVYSQCHC